MSWSDHPDCTNLSLVSSAPGSREEFWQNIWTNSDMPHVIQHYFIQIGDNLTWDRPWSHYPLPMLIAAFLPLYNCLAPPPMCTISAITGSMSHVTTLPDVTTPNAPQLPTCHHMSLMTKAWPGWLSLHSLILEHSSLYDYRVLNKPDVDLCRW